MSPLVPVLTRTSPKLQIPGITLGYESLTLITPKLQISEMLFQLLAPKSRLPLLPVSSRFQE